MFDLLLPNTLGFVSTTSIILISVVALILFGPKKLPQFGRAFGSTLKEFKDATKGLVSDDDEDEEKEKKPQRLEVTEVESTDGTHNVTEVKEVKDVDNTKNI